MDIQRITTTSLISNPAVVWLGVVFLLSVLAFNPLPSLAQGYAFGGQEVTGANTSLRTSTGSAPTKSATTVHFFDDLSFVDLSEHGLSTRFLKPVEVFGGNVSHVHRFVIPASPELMYTFPVYPVGAKTIRIQRIRWDSVSADGVTGRASNEISVLGTGYAGVTQPLKGVSLMPLPDLGSTETGDVPGTSTSTDIIDVTQTSFRAGVEIYPVNAANAVILKVSQVTGNAFVHAAEGPKNVQNSTEEIIISWDQEIFSPLIGR